MSRRRRLALLALPLAACLAVVAWQCHRQPPALPADEAGLAGRLRRLGYVVHVEPADRPLGDNRVALAGLYASRGEPASWDDVASLPRGDPRLWHGRLVAVRRGGASAGDRDYLAVGP